MSSIFLQEGFQTSWNDRQCGLTYELLSKNDLTIVIGKTTKKQVFDTYGQPATSAIKGKYEVLVYSYSKETFKTMGVGGALLRAVPGVGEAVLLSDLATDQGKADRENTAREWQDCATCTWVTF